MAAPKTSGRGTTAKMYSILASSNADRIFAKLSKKNPKQMEIICKKVEEISKNPSRYKNLKSPLSHLKRVHIDTHFVLVFEVNETEKEITLIDYAHHDNIYL